MGSGRAGLRQSRPKKPEKRLVLNFSGREANAPTPTPPSSHVNKNTTSSLDVMGNQPQDEAYDVDSKAEGQGSLGY